MQPTASLDRYAKINVVFERRSDGGLRVYSDDVPGFILSHPDRDAVLADVKPALETIISAIVGHPVKVALLTTLHDRLGDAPLPAPETDHATHEFVTHLAA